MNRKATPRGPQSGSASHLAELIQEDIRAAGVKSGDRYLNGPEVAKKYGVTLIMANRALQALARRKILERRQRAGTFIGSNYRGPESASNLRCIHLLMPTPYFRTSRANVEQSLSGFHAELPECNIQYTFLPASGEILFARQLVEQANANGSAAGVVLYLSPPEIQQFFRESKIPAVVFGSVYPEADGLPWVDRDQKQIGRILADFLTSEKHQKVAVLMRERWGYGDSLLMDGLQAAFSATKSPIAVRVRSVPSVEEMGTGVIRALLKGDDAPTALICRSEKVAATAAWVAHEMGIKVPKQLRLVVAESSSLYPCVQPVTSQEEQGAIIGRMLKQIGNGHKPSPDHVLVPVQFHNPLAS